ncbi:hypothetical protein, partial [Aliikangiella maris]
MYIRNEGCHSCSVNPKIGYVYKQRDYRQRDIVGKQMICSQRYGRSGCGRTRQLYLQQVVPGRHYLLTTLLA